MFLQHKHRSVYRGKMNRTITLGCNALFKSNETRGKGFCIYIWYKIQLYNSYFLKLESVSTRKRSREVRSGRPHVSALLESCSSVDCLSGASPARRKGETPVRANFQRDATCYLLSRYSSAYVIVFFVLSTALKPPLKNGEGPGGLLRTSGWGN